MQGPEDAPTDRFQSVSDIDHRSVKVDFLSVDFEASGGVVREFHLFQRGQRLSPDDELRILEVSENDRFLNILVHEYSHMKQWIEGLAIWRTKYKGYEPYDVVHNWLHEGKEYPEDVLDKCFGLVKEVELDCEKRAVETINKWKLPINTKTYTKCAIAYLYYFDYMRHYRKVGCSYESQKILKLIKPDFSKYNLNIRNLNIECLMNEETNK
jgi:hypothetical protein